MLGLGSVFDSFWGPMIFGALIAVVGALSGVGRMRSAQSRRRLPGRLPGIVSLVMVLVLAGGYVYYVKVVIGEFPTQ